MPFIDKSPLEYQVNTATSIRRWEDTRPPTNADFRQFRLGDLWIDTTSRLWWILAFRDTTQGLWRMLGTTPGGLTNLTPDVGGIITPDMANNINLLGSTNIVTTGNPATNTITLSTSGGGPIPQYLQGNAGGPVTPDAGSITYIVGTATNGINVVGNAGTFTLTAALSGLYTDGDFIFRNDAVATPRVVTISNSNANAASSANLTIAVPTASFDPFVLFQINATQTYAMGIDNSAADAFKITDGTSPSNGNILFQITSAGVPSFPIAGALGVDAGGTGVTSITANALIYGNGVNPVVEIGPLTDGQLIIGSTGVAPVASTLTAGAGIVIANGAGSITITSTAGGFGWEEVVAATKNMADNFAYGANRAGGVAFTLPAVSAAGSDIEVVGMQGLWSISQGAGQQILYGDTNTTAGAGGSITATNAGDCISIKCITANTTWRMTSAVGSLTIV